MASDPTVSRLIDALAADAQAAAEEDAFAQRPEVFVGAAFGFATTVLALSLFGKLT